jgi:hypothetical protein
MDFFADNALVLRSEGLVIAFKGVQKGYWTFSKPYGRGLHRFIASPENADTAFYDERRYNRDHTCGSLLEIY